eukprot:gb/GFBE01065725.1/.p1 GENE.gb/GFBE01065725.1/~~gb/GFBE01065725.1/.p1  ORF type:complete len:179 (+),score=30.12 gb/GFBE01065725.1/:1-537(+)
MVVMLANAPQCIACILLACLAQRTAAHCDGASCRSTLEWQEGESLEMVLEASEQSLVQTYMKLHSPAPHKDQKRDAAKSEQQTGHSVHITQFWSTWYLEVREHFRQATESVRLNGSLRSTIVGAGCAALLLAMGLIFAAKSWKQSAFRVAWKADPVDMENWHGLFIEPRRFLPTGADR